MKTVNEYLKSIGVEDKQVLTITHIKDFDAFNVKLKDGREILVTGQQLI